ncbi:hypothetical protein [Nonomuraea dietziae]|uniref:hypothetical protein n=1 Tax=Nonomuraea dietziae TaxID=65515 RepID=UPI003CD07B2C
MPLISAISLVMASTGRSAVPIVVHVARPISVSRTIAMTASRTFPCHPLTPEGKGTAP